MEAVRGWVLIFSGIAQSRNLCQISPTMTSSAFNNNLTFCVNFGIIHTIIFVSTKNTICGLQGGNLTFLYWRPKGGKLTFENLKMSNFS